MSTNTLKKRGPKPVVPGEVLKREIATIDSLTKRKLIVLGGGNFSKGVRVAAEVAFDRYQSMSDQKD